MPFDFTAGVLAGFCLGVMAATGVPYFAGALKQWRADGRRLREAEFNAKVRAVVSAMKKR